MSESMSDREFQSLQERERWLLQKKKLKPQEHEELTTVQQRLALHQETRGRVQSVTSSVASTPANASPEYSLQKQRLDAALNAAAALGLIRVEEEGPKNARECCILTSGHYQSVYVNAAPEQHVRQSQYELFTLLHLMRLEGVQGPLFVEGRLPGQKPSHQLGFTHNRRPLNAKSDEAQQLMANDPNMFIGFLEHTRADGGPSQFFDFSAYPNIEGGQHEKTDKVMEELADAAPFIDGLIRKYQPPALPQEGTVGDIASGWFGKQSIYLYGAWRPVTEVYRDYGQWIDVLKKHLAMNVVRADEMADFIASSDADVIPMSWMGGAHEFDLKAACLRRGMRVRTVLPAGFLPVRELSKSLARNSALNIKTMERVREHIRQRCPKVS